MRNLKEKKAVIEEGTFHCNFSFNGATKEYCKNISSIPSRAKICFTGQCSSPHRVCIGCVLMREVCEESTVVDFEKGLCKFHKEHGWDAKRKKKFKNPEPLEDYFINFKEPDPNEK